MMRSRREPPAPDNPLFVYGPLKPGEFAYSLIEQYVSERTPSTIRGGLRLRNGLPLFNPDSSSDVHGYLLRFNPVRSQDAWEAVGKFKSNRDYKYDTVDVNVGSELVCANVLVGKQLDQDTAPESTDCWSAASDPLFVEGLLEVAALTVENAPSGVASQPDDRVFWRGFLRLQATYLLLWAIVERYTAFRYGPGLEPGVRIKCLREDPAFQDAVGDGGALRDIVFDARNPRNRATLEADGSGASRYFYQIRSNLSHRGKSASQERQLVFRALVQLHDAMRKVLAKQCPALPDKWQFHEPNGWLLRSRVPREDLGAGRTA